MYNFKSYLPFYRRNLKVAAPVMLTQFGAAMAGIIDSAMVGHYGTAELAAVSFANSIFFTAMVFAMGAVMGVTPLVGYAFVQKKDSRVADLFRSGFLFTVLLSVFMVLVLGAFVWIMPHMGQDPEVIRVAMPYYILAVASILPFLLFHLQKQFLEGLGNTMAAMIIAISLNLLNILLNWIFIFGHWGSPALGAEGAGIATLIIRTLQPVVFFLVILSVPSWRKYVQRVSGFSLRKTLAEVWEVARIGLPIGLQQTIEIFAFTASVTLVGWISKEAVAAHQIGNHISDLTFMVSMGIGAATTIRVAHQYGAGKIYEMRMAARASMHLGLVWSLFGAAVMFSCCGLIPRLFTQDEEVIRIARVLLILGGIYQISDAMQCIGGAMLRGIADVKWPVVIAIVAYLVIALPLGYVLMFPLGMGVNGIWVGFIAGLTIAAVLLHWRFWKIAPKVQLKNEISQ